jgi:DUF971 family protein
MSERITPVKLKLKKDDKLEVVWGDGVSNSFPVRFLRARCPCAACRDFRDKSTKTRLMVLPATHEGAIVVTAAEQVGNYAIRLTFSDGHATGIYSFEYLRVLGDAVENSDR